MQKLMVITGLGLLLGACGGEALDRDDEGTPGAARAAGGKADDPVPPPTLASRYAVRITSEVETRNRTTGETGAHTITVDGLAVVTQDGASVTLSVQTCRATLPAIAGRQPALSDAVVQGLAPVVASGTLTAEGQAHRLDASPTALVIGARLAEPLTEALPTEASDPRVFDEDGDRRPGMSIAVSPFKVYGAVRVVLSQLSGLVGADLGVAGTARLDPSYEIYGDNIPFFDAKAEADKAKAETEITAQRDSFTMRALGADATCAQALE